MSDAIVLDVAEQPTIALDVGTADPVARDEIAELAGQVDAIMTDYVPRAEVVTLDADAIDALFSS